MQGVESQIQKIVTRRVVSMKWQPGITAVNVVMTDSIFQFIQMQTNSEFDTDTLPVININGSTLRVLGKADNSNLFNFPGLGSIWMGPTAYFTSNAQSSINITIAYDGVNSYLCTSTAGAKGSFATRSTITAPINMQLKTEV